MKDQEPNRMFTGCNWFGLPRRGRLAGASCPPLLGQAPFLQLLHKSTNMVENTKRLLHVIRIIVSVLGAVAIRVFEEAELRIHFCIDITIWTTRHRPKLACDFVDNILPIGARPSAHHCCQIRGMGQPMLRTFLRYRRE